MSWGRLKRLIAHLPRDSWTLRAVGGDQTRWGESEHLLATIIDLLAHQGWMYGRVNFKPAPTFPTPLRRPGQPDPVKRLGGKRKYTLREIDAVLARARAEGGD